MLVLLFLAAIVPLGYTGLATSHEGAGLVNFRSNPVYISPDDPFTQSFTVIGDVSGVMINDTFHLFTELLSFYDSSSVLRVQVPGVFSSGMVNLSTWVMTMGPMSMAVNEGNSTNLGEKTFYLPNTQSLGVFVCPNATSVAETVQGCMGFLQWSFAETLANTTKGGITVWLFNNTYVIAHLVHSGVAENSQSAGQVSSGGSGGVYNSSMRLPAKGVVPPSIQRATYVATGDSYSVWLRKGDSVKLQNGGDSVVVLKDVSAQEVIIGRGYAEFRLSLNKVQLIDLDGDGSADWSVKLIELNDAARLEFSRIAGPLPKEERGLSAEVVPLQEVLDTVTKVDNRGMVAVVVGLVVFVFCCFFLLGRHMSHPKVEVPVSPHVESIDESLRRLDVIIQRSKKLGAKKRKR